MPTKKPKVTIYLTEAHKAELHKWADSEKRSISNLVELLVEKALNDRIQSEPNGDRPQPTPEPPPAKGKRK